MATEYKLDYTASDINNKLGVVDELNASVVKYVTQELTEEQKAQVCVNIGAKTSTSEIPVWTLGVYPNAPDKETEYSAIIQNFLNNNTDRATLVFDEGTYYLSQIYVTMTAATGVIALAGQAWGDFDCARPVQYYKTIINTRGKDFIVDNSSVQINWYVKDLIIRSTGQQGKCFSSSTTSENNFYMAHVHIESFDYGIEIMQWSCGGSGGKDITVGSCRNGIIMGTSSHLCYFDGLSLNYNRLGIDMKNGGRNATIRNLHVATGYAGADRDDYTEFVAVHTNGGLNLDGVYAEDYIGNDGYGATKQIVVDFTYNHYNNSPLVIKDISLNHAEGSKKDAALRMSLATYSHNVDFPSDILFISGVRVFDETAIRIDSAKEQCGICINGQNMSSNLTSVLFNRKWFYSTANKCTYNSDYAFTDAESGNVYRRLVFGDGYFANDVFYDKRLTKTSASMYKSFFRSGSMDFRLKLKLKVVPTDTTNEYLTLYIKDYQTNIEDITLYKAADCISYEGEWEWFVPSNTQYWGIYVLDGSPACASSTTFDYVLEAEQLTRG